MPDRSQRRPRGFRPAQRPDSGRLLTGLLLFIVALVVSGAGAFLMTRFGPRKVDALEVSSLDAEDPRVEGIRTTVAKWVEEFEGVEELREIKEKDLETLERALKYQAVVIDFNQGSVLEDILYRDHLKKRYDDYKGGFEFERSRQEEKLAEEALEAGDRQTALIHLRKSLYLQEKIRGEFGSSEFRNKQREVQIRHRIDGIQAGPIHEESLALEALADEAMAADRWQEAYGYLRQALEKQRQINEEFRNTGFADVRRLERLEDDSVSIRSGRGHQQILEVLARAEARRAAGAHREAANHFEEAVALQRRLNETFPDSRFASAQKVEDFEVKRQTALSSKLAASIRATEAALDGLLRDRQTAQARELINQLVEDVGRLQESFPKSEHHDDARASKVTYLNFARGALDQIQDEVLPNLIPLTSGPGPLLFRSEVPQSLYRRIMNDNPSRRRGPALPVDSLDWTQANLFCQRLGWVLGREVRLPSLEEFHQAVGDLRYAPLLEWSWCLDNSEGRAHEVASKAANRVGFFDVLGNLAEWLAPAGEPGADAGPENARVAGGSFADSGEDLLKVPVETVPSDRRSRTVGFRFLVVPPAPEPEDSARASR